MDNFGRRVNRIHMEPGAWRQASLKIKTQVMVRLWIVVL
jgi:hypothetical protein